MPLSVFLTLVDQNKSGLSQLKVTNPKKEESQLSPKSLFTSRIGHGDSCVIADTRSSLHVPIVSVVGANSETNSPFPVLEEVFGRHHGNVNDSTGYTSSNGCSSLTRTNTNTNYGTKCSNCSTNEGSGRSYN